MRTLVNTFSEFPEAPSGYPLNPEYSYFWVVVPEATVNLVTNPIFGLGVGTNYAASSSTLAVVTTWQAFGAYGLRILPTASIESGVYYGSTTPISMTSGVTYTGSAVIQGEAGKEYYIWFADTAGTLLGTKRKWIGTGYKQRIWITYTAAASANRRLYVTRDAKYSDTNYFYADGFQVEAKDHPTTVCHGDMTGFVLGRVDYYWNGTPHSSSSTRTALTRSGGREMNLLLDLSFIVLGIFGLGMEPIVDQSIPLPGFGEYSVGSGTASREFSIAGAILSYSNNPRMLQALRKRLITTLSPNTMTFDQPLLIRYQACDEEGHPVSETVDILCKLSGGLEGQWDNHQQERLAITFKMHLPFISNTYSTGATLGYQTTVADFANIGYRNVSGTWLAAGTGINGPVEKIVIGPDGCAYIAGNFLSAGGVANTEYLAKWDGSGFSSLGFNAAGIVYDIVFGPDGAMYVGGAFTNAGGVVGATYVAKYLAGVWSSVGAAGMGADVYALAIDNNGILYAGGSFTNFIDANGDRISKYDGANWTSLGTGMNQSVSVLQIGPDRCLYAGGSFTSAGGVTYTNKIAKWNGTVWAPLGTGVSHTAGGGAIVALAFAPNGELYLGGDIDFGGTLPVNNVAKWNGTQYSALGSGLTGGAAAVNDLIIGPDGSLYAAGQFTMAGGILLPEHMAVWSGGAWSPIDIDIADAAAIIGAIAIDTSGQLYIGGFWASTDAYSATVTVSNLSGSRAYPRIVFTGPGTLWQLRNYTNGKVIYFKTLTLLAGEVAVLDLDPVNGYFKSNFRANLNSYIAVGSDLDFYIEYGDNNISTYMQNATAASSIVAYWNQLYESLDGAVIE